MAMTPEHMQAEIERLTAERDAEKQRADAQQQRAEVAEARLQQERDVRQAVQQLHEEFKYAQLIAERRHLAQCYLTCAAQARAFGCA